MADTLPDGFSRDWLSMREPWDLTARERAAPALGLDRLGQRLRERAGTSRLRVLDLACGTGANLRALAPRLGGAQDWTLMDHDRLLLDAVPARLNAWAAAQGWRLSARPGGLHIEGDGFDVEVRAQRRDLSVDVAGWPMADAHLLTASALLDLVSAPWLAQVADACTAARVPVLFALSVDGQLVWQPPDPDDSWVQSLFEAHQGRDKGFGPALGPRAADVAARLFGQRDALVVRASSPWILEAVPDTPPTDTHALSPAAALLREMVQGMPMAAAEQAGLGATPAPDRMRVEAWCTRRLSRAASTRLELGHTDLLAWPRNQPLSSVD